MLRQTYGWLGSLETEMTRRRRGMGFLRKQPASDNVLCRQRFLLVFALPNRVESIDAWIWGRALVS